MHSPWCIYVSSWKFRKDRKNTCVKQKGLVKLCVMICHRYVIDMFDQLPHQQLEMTENNSPGMPGDGLICLHRGQSVHKSIAKIELLFEIIYQFIKVYNAQLSRYGSRALGHDVSKVPCHICCCRLYGHHSNSGMEDESKLRKTFKTP